MRILSAGLRPAIAFEPRDFPRFWEGEIGCVVRFRACGISARRLESKKGALERLLAEAAAERLTEELQTCGKEIYARTRVLIGTVDGFIVELTLPGWFSEPEEGWNEKES